MVDRPERAEATAGGAPDAERKPWASPRIRVMKTHAAENGPNFPTADGIEGQS